MPRIYNADHTAHVRNRLKNQTVYFSSGMVMAVLGAIGFAIILSMMGQAPHTLAAVAWGLVIVLVVVSGVGLALTGVEFLIYLRRRADLDAAGAEAIGELYARLHRPTDDQ